MRSTSPYRVGQVVYVVLRKKATIFPVQVVKEVIERTLEGEATSYVVRVGSDPAELLPLSKIEGEMFDSPDAARETLVSRASREIAAKIKQAVQNAKGWYPSGFESGAEDTVAALARVEATPRPEVAALAAELQQDDGSYVELPGGGRARVASVKLPDALK